MHVQSDITTYDSRLWTRTELDAWAAEHCKHSSLYLPDDSLYATIKHKEDVKNQVELLKKHLKLHRNIDLKLSDVVGFPGLCTYYDKKLQITLPYAAMGSSIISAACIAHLLAHGTCLISKKVSVDNIENERIADIVAIQAGLGIVLLNGMNSGGWHTLLHKNPINKTKVFGYFTPAQAALHTKEYIEKRNENEVKAAKHTVSWLRPLLTHKKSQRKDTEPAALQVVSRKHMSSRRWFTALAALISGIILLGGYTWLNSTNALDSELQGRLKAAQDLKIAHAACLERLTALREELPKDQLSSDRLLSFEQSRCKSLQNRYNSAADSYNRYLRTN
jgi:hypothetical protein